MGSSNENYAYTAGLIDGEGHVSIVNRPDRRTGVPTIVVEMSSYEVITYLRDTFNLGGFIAVKSEKITINRPGDGKLPIGRLTVLLVKYTPI